MWTHTADIFTFSAGSRAGGGIAIAPAITQVSSATMAAATAELAQRTGLTDSEGEGEEAEQPHSGEKDD